MHIKTVSFMSFAAPLKKTENEIGQHSQADPSSTTGQKIGQHSRWGFSTLDRKVETHPSRANRDYFSYA
jgi:hypothetical protein